MDNKRKAKGKRQPLSTPAAPESEERRGRQLAQMQVKRLRNALTRQQELVRHYVPPERRVKPRIDPNWELKGAARPAQEYYQPPSNETPVTPENLLETYANRLSEHPEGLTFLQIHLDLAVALHNLVGRTREAISVLNEALSFDESETLGLRHALLRLHLDSADGVAARQLIGRYPEDRSSCFMYSAVLLEFISYRILAEEGASEATVVAAVEAAIEANPYTVWYLAYSDVFEQAVELVDRITEAAVGSVEDAFTYCASDLSLWRDTEGALGWIQDFVEGRRLQPPSSSGSDEFRSRNPDEDAKGHEISQEDHIMYLTMFDTAIGMMGERAKSKRTQKPPVYSNRS